MIGGGHSGVYHYWHSAMWGGGGVSKLVDSSGRFIQ